MTAQLTNVNVQHNPLIRQWMIHIIGMCQGLLIYELYIQFMWLIHIFLSIPFVHGKDSLTIYTILPSDKLIFVLTR